MVNDRMLLLNDFIEDRSESMLLRVDVFTPSRGH